MSTSPACTPAFAAGDPGSTLVTTGYESKKALPRSSIIAWSEILTPNHPVGGGTGAGGACCAEIPEGRTTHAINANPSHDPLPGIEMFIPLTIA
jgi:hypothetical protein